MRQICVFCGSRSGVSYAYEEGARRLGWALAKAGITLVYGGGRVGLMGVLADTVLGSGGEVIGVIPKALVRREVAHAGLSDLRVVGSMHERKALMSELSEGFVMLPGGIGTLEELVEQMTWQQLGRHTKPVLLANIDGFWEPLIALLAHMRETEFIRASMDIDILKAERVEDIVPRLRAAAAHAPEGSKEMAPELARKL